MSMCSTIEQVSHKTQLSSSFCDIPSMFLLIKEGSDKVVSGIISGEGAWITSKLNKI
jgi:hypothetical protein